MSRTLGYLDEKIRDVFPQESVYKDDNIRSILGTKKIPSFIRDWLIKKFSREDGLDKEGLLQFLETYMSDRSVRFDLIRDPHSHVDILARLVVKADIKKGIIRFELPDLGNVEGVVSMRLIDRGVIYSEGEYWGVCRLVAARDEKEGYIELVDFKPFNPYRVDLDYYIDARKEFTTEEWIDLLIRSMEFNPEALTLDQKLTLLCRLTVFVEPNLNIIELAPKGTGKSYVFSNLSKYGLLISGGSVSRAKLFYNKKRREPGVVLRYDYIAFDEIQTISFSDPEEMSGILKSYLESGDFSMEDYRGKASASFVLLGNIPLNESRLPVYEKYFSDLPEIFRESALLDRFHGFIEGWKLPRFHEGMKLVGYALNVEYFSDILHLLRERSEYLNKIMELVEIPRNADSRDKRAILKLSSALLKLIFPDAHIREPDRKELEVYVLSIAKNMRAIIKNQLHLMDREYAPTVPDIRLK